MSPRFVCRVWSLNIHTLLLATDLFNWLMECRSIHHWSHLVVSNWSNQLLCVCTVICVWIFCLILVNSYTLQYNVAYFTLELGDLTTIHCLALCVLYTSALFAFTSIHGSFWSPPLSKIGACVAFFKPSDTKVHQCHWKSAKLAHEVHEYKGYNACCREMGGKGWRCTRRDVHVFASSRII